MDVRFTVGTADLAAAQGDVLALLLDDDLKYAPPKGHPLRAEAERWLRGAKKKEVWEHPFTRAKAARFAFVGFLPLRLEFFQDGRDQARSAAAKVVDFARKRHLDRIAFLLEPTAAMELIELIVEGVVLGAYEFTEFRDSIYPLKRMHVELLVAEGNLSAARRMASQRQKVCEAANGARSLVNRPGSVLPPEALAEHARKVAQKHRMRFTLLRHADLKRGGHVGLLNVGAGSAHPPVMFALEYQGSERRQLDLALVGKGISFDSGGISLKPWDKMWEMKGDMSGAAAVIHVLEAVAALKLKKNVTAVVPSAENRPDARAYLPGDILRYRNGVSVEIHSTDAEGRLILADALLWVQERFKAKKLVDVATLTGACARALGPNYSGIMFNDEELAAQLQEAGERAGEKLWPLPLPVEYEEQLLSPVAKIKNVGGALAGASTAGLFLQRFIGAGVKWAHLDIAGTFFYDKKQRYFLQPGATGVMVRTLTDFIAKM